jgi:Holliday junction resolvase RusA-like endonuclease
MTRQDVWKKRPAVLRYRKFKDKVREAFTVAGGRPASLPWVTRVDWVAYFPIPKSWSKSKRAEMAGTPHRSKPDRDNVDKAILDALFEEDSGVSIGTLEKRWDDGGGSRVDVYFG